MPARIYNLSIEQGSNYTLTIPVLNDNNSPVTVTGWSATGQIRERYDSALVLHDLDLTATGTSVILRVPAEVSSTWTWTIGRYDIEIASPDGLVETRLIQGLVVVRPEITR